MLRNVKELTGYRILSIDDILGKLKDIFFDEIEWNIRYLVADTGKWLKGRRVLISPSSCGTPNWGAKIIPVSLTKQEIENSPDISEKIPVSVAIEKELAQYYQWPAYWTTPGAFPVGNDSKSAEKVENIEKTIHVRSTEEVIGYRILAKNGEIGHVDDFILEDDTWIIRYMIVDTRNWLPGRKVLISPQWVEKLDWKNQQVHIHLLREIIEKGPVYDPEHPVSREYEDQLFELYGVKKYWKSI